MKIRGQHSDRTLSTVCRQLSIVSLVCLLGCDLSHRRAHAVARTREDIQNISVAIQNYVNDRGTLPAEIPAEKEFGMDAKKVYLLLFKNAAPKNVFGEPGQYWIDVGEITDRWGRPLNFRARLISSNLFRVSVWSSGPNGRNEGGIGDDIVGKPFLVTVNHEAIIKFSS